MVRYDNEKNSIELLISFIRVENLIMRPRECYNSCILTDIFHRRITKKARYRDCRGSSHRPSEDKEMYLRRLSIGEPILSNRENGFLFFDRKTVHTRAQLQL